MSDEYFITIIGTDKTIRIPITNAHPFEYESISLFAHEEDDGWCVSEKVTGGNVIDHVETEANAISSAKKVIDKFGIRYIKSIINKSMMFVTDKQKIKVN